MEQKLKEHLEAAKAVLYRDCETLTLKGNDLVDKNGKSLYKDFAIVDHISKESDVVATIFAKNGDDYRRISTSLTDASGNRAVDTMLDRNGPVYPNIQAGKDYSGTADVLGKHYLTEYMPLFATGSTTEVIGILFVGLEE
jgi:methyl-accepting chemotaxis protein